MITQPEIDALMRAVGDAIDDAVRELVARMATASHVSELATRVTDLETRIANYEKRAATNDARYDAQARHLRNLEEKIGKLSRGAEQSPPIGALKHE